MKQSVLFQRTSKEVSEQHQGSRNAELLTKAGFINQLMAGVYSYMPLGLKVLRKIENIVREEMDAIGANEILMPALAPRENWDVTGRYDEIDVLFKFKGAGNRDLVLNPTHEEIVTPIAKTVIQSYKDMPTAVYQIQNKFRNEARAKSGIMRGREFSMKDMYSFHTTQNDLDKFYEMSTTAYERVYRRLGLGDITYKTFASGGAFSKYSHEFQTVTEFGEDTIYIIPGTKTAINKEIIDDVEALKDIIPNYKPGDEKNLEQVKAVEVGNIFKLGTRFSSAFNLSYLDENGQLQNPFMGCYGIGPSRLMGTIAEILSDEHGLNWGKDVSPFNLHLISLCHEDKDIKKVDDIYNSLLKAGIDVLYDNRMVSAGVKLNDTDLIGIYNRIIISQETLKNNRAEFSNRGKNSKEMVDLSTIINFCIDHCK